MSSEISALSTPNENFDLSRQSGVYGRLSPGASITYEWSGNAAAPTITTSGNILPPSTTAPRPLASPSVILSLSPAATAALDREQIALRLIVGSTTQEVSRPSAKAPMPRPAPAASPDGTTAGSNRVTGNSTDTTITQLRQMSATERFYATTDVAEFTGPSNFWTPSQQASFIAAYNARTLNIQAASDIPGIYFHESETFSATGMGEGESGSSSWNGSQNGPNCFMHFDPLFGGTFVSWGTGPDGQGGAPFKGS